MLCSQPRRVGSFSDGGGQLICRGGPILFYMMLPNIRYKSRGTSTLAGGPGPPTLRAVCSLAIPIRLKIIQF